MSEPTNCQHRWGNGGCLDCGRTLAELLAPILSPAPDLSALWGDIEGLYRVVPSDLEGDAIWDHNAEYVRLDDVREALLKAGVSRPEGTGTPAQETQG